MTAQSPKDASEKARTERKAKRKFEKAEAAHMADQRRKKNVKLNQPRGISSGGTAYSKPFVSKDMICFKCGEKGHPQRDCSQSSQEWTKRR